MTTSDLKQIQINSAIELFSKGEINQALDTVQELFKYYPDDPLLLNISGACYAGLGQLDFAVKNYKKAIALNPYYAKAHFNLAGAFQELGQLKSAVISYKKALEIEPGYAEAHNNLANVFKELKENVSAAKSFKKALEIKPDYIEAQYSLGITLQDLGQFETAIKHYEMVLAVKPDFADAYNNIGAAYLNLAQLDNAVKSYKSALKLKPDFLGAINNLGIAFYKLNQFDDAMDCYERALVLNPDFADVYNNIGIVLIELGQLDEAVKNYKSALILNPDFADAHNNLGIAYLDLAQLDKAVKSYKAAIKIKPDFVEAINNLGIAFYKLNQLDDAMDCYERALVLNPDFADVYNNIGIVLIELGQLDEAVKNCNTALKLNPEHVEANNNIGNAFKKLLQKNEAIRFYERAIAIKPDDVSAYANLASVMVDLKRHDEALKIYESAIIQNSNLDFILGQLLHTKMHLSIWSDLPRELNELRSKINNREKVLSPFALLALIDNPELQRKNAEIFANDLPIINHDLSKIGYYPKHERIRIGYFSADFREHPVSALTVELFELHDRSQFEIYAFSYGPDSKDAMNLRIKAGVDHFYDIHKMSYVDSVKLSRSFEIDIAVDLGGFTADTRMEIFAMSVAPIQTSYIGYLGTMGASYYDYLIADQITIPEKNQKYYSEKIAYLPSYQVNNSKQEIPDTFFTRKDLDLPEEGFIFCCFNNSFKITPTTFDSWGRILNEVDGSVLLIYADNDSAKINLTKEIVARGICANRLIFGKRLAKSEYLARYRVADLFLDTLPFNAATTASDALRMGLPVLTCIGNSFASRMGASLLKAVDLPELIKTSQEEYESFAIELAMDSEKFKIIKDKLVSNLPSALLYDTPAFARSLESVYLTMYESYHKRLESEHIYL